MGITLPEENDQFFYDYSGNFLLPNQFFYFHNPSCQYFRSRKLIFVKTETNITVADNIYYRNVMVRCERNNDQI